MAKKLVVILGPTGVGKTDFSIGRALEAGSPVISCDSRQIYKEMSIGTAVPDEAQLAAVPPHFIRTRSVKDPYTAGDYERDALELIDRLFAEGHETLVMTGGSMMYIDAVCNGLDNLPEVPLLLREQLMNCLESEGVEPLAEQLRDLDPETYSTIDRANGQRVVRALEVCIYTGVPFSSFKTGQSKKRDFEIEKIGLERPREELYDRINRRVDRMMEEGLVEEARRLIPYRDLPALQTVGYRELFRHFDGEYGLDKAVELIKRNSRHYAKRQLTWWRRDDSIRWISL